MITEKEYFSKVYGCWIGKSIGGAIGMEYEGVKEFLDIPFEFPAEAIENDDLDLQLVWLEALRQHKSDVDALKLSEYWLGHITYPFSEYAVAIANLKHGLKPPESGYYNNYFHDCMGAPIRSELWACLAPGRPEVAAYYAWQDAIVDHYQEGVYGEIFFACLESLAFKESDLRTLIREALNYISSESQVRQVVELAISLYDSGKKFRESRDAVLSEFGNHSFTHCLQNIGFTILGLLYGEGNFLKSMVLAANCGYDTDCTAATVGALLGIIYGREQIQEKCQCEFDERIIPGWGVKNISPPATISELTNELASLKKDFENLPGSRTLPENFKLPEIKKAPKGFNVPIFYSTEYETLDEFDSDVVEGNSESIRKRSFENSFIKLKDFIGSKTCNKIMFSLTFNLKIPRRLGILLASENESRLLIDGQISCSQNAGREFMPASNRPESPTVVLQYLPGKHRVSFEIISPDIDTQAACIFVDENCFPTYEMLLAEDLTSA